MSMTRARQLGFTLIETVATLTIISLVAVNLVTLSDYLLNHRQRQTTIDRMNELRRAINGSPAIISGEARISFGYLGDMGVLPGNLQDLWVKGSQPSFTFDGVKKTGAGWNGPYLEVGNTPFSQGLALDGWGNAFDYSTVSFNDIAFGATAFGKLVSMGRDVTPGGDDDIAMNFFQAETVSQVQGYVKDSQGNMVPGVGITINYPVDGILSSQMIYADGDAHYVATGIPFGNRSITINPLLVVAQGTVQKSGSFSDGYRDLQFKLKNFSSDDISVAKLSLSYSVSPSAWFTEIDVANKKVWKYPPQPARFGNGDSVNFATQTVNGTGANLESFPIRVQSFVTDVPDLGIGNVGKGGLLQIDFKGFNTAQTGAGSDADVSGIDFQVIFYDASNKIVGTIVITP